MIADAGRCHQRRQARTLWHLRESIPLAQSLEGLNIKHDISVPISRIPTFVRATDEAGACHPWRALVDFGHLGDGNLHYNVPQAPENEPADLFLIEREDGEPHRHAVMAHSSSISAEHGVGTRSSATSWRNTEVAGGLDADARHQTGARSARPHEPRPVI